MAGKANAVGVLVAMLRRRAATVVAACEADMVGGWREVWLALAECPAGVRPRLYGLLHRGLRAASLHWLAQYATEAVAELTAPPAPLPLALPVGE